MTLTQTPTLTKPVVMGILNVSPDSFSGDGKFASSEAAIARGRQLFNQGAAIVDVGGESTRPGAQPVSLDEELNRVLKVVEGLVPHGRVSIDTTKAEVALAAANVGASILNDVSGRLFVTAAKLGLVWIAVHRQGTPATMQNNPSYNNVVNEVADFLLTALKHAKAAGVAEVWLDPGIGFGKTTAHNLELLAGLNRFVQLGAPVVLGASRKRFIGELHARSDNSFADHKTGLSSQLAKTQSVTEVPTDDRLEGSLATATWAFAQGISVVRAHDVAYTVNALKVVAGQEAALAQTSNSTKVTTA